MTEQLHSVETHKESDVTLGPAHTTRRGGHSGLPGSFHYNGNQAYRRARNPQSGGEKANGGMTSRCEIYVYAGMIEQGQARSVKRETGAGEGEVVGMPSRVGGGGGSGARGQGVDLALVSLYGAARVEGREIEGWGHDGGWGSHERATLTTLH